LSRVLLVRHGFIGLKDERFLGRTDIPLSDAGEKQAEKLRDRLVLEKINAIYTSTLRRARATADIIASAHKVAVTTFKELCECDFGDIEGLNFEEIQQKFPELAKELTLRKTGNFPGGETLEQLNKRIKIFLKRLEKHKLEETVLVVTHGGPVRLIICNLLGLGLEHWVQMRIDHASLSIVETYPDTAILTLLNDVSHLN
jgi:broad specificity phosphatase PhoE